MDPSTSHPSPRWRQAAEIATQAADLPAREVPRFLDSKCTTSELRTEVEALLATWPTAEGQAVAGDPPPPSLERIGPYDVVRTLGVGGMGEVFLARQHEPIEREVAIKLIRTTVSGTAGQRFLLERRALARMRHPFIAQIYEAGETRQGRPFLAMEYVDGEAVDKYCKKHRLTIPERLRLFCSICDGVHHAHQKGLLHRDIKPGNILITELDGKPVPKIIDFGIAKELDAPGVGPAQLTRDGGLVGTPAYLSPEAIMAPENDVDIRSDVYSLGVLLYRLVVDRVPLDEEGSSWLDALTRATREETPPPSSLWKALDADRRREAAAARRTSEKALLSLIRPDLDAIARKATALDRDERYSSAAELASDVRRFRTHRPILARRGTSLYEAKKFIRRHRASAFAAALVVLALIVGLVARTFEARRADRAAAEALKAQEDTRQVVEFLVGLFEVSDPEQSLGATVTARELLDKGAERVRTELEDQPRAKARLLDTMGVVYGRLGLSQEATTLLSEALVVRRTDGDDLEIAETLLHLGNARFEDSETEVARRHLEEALELRREALGPRHPLVAEVLDALGQLHEVAAEYIRAEELLEEALDIRTEHFGPDGDPTLKTLNHLALVINNRGDYAAAQAIFERLLASRERLHGPEHPEVARVLNALGIAVYLQDLHAEAEVHLRRSLAIREKIYGGTHRMVAQSLTNLANVLLEQDRKEEGLATMERSIQVLEAVYGGELHNSVAIALHNLGDYYVREGELERAEELLRRALAASTELNGELHPIPAFSAQRLGDVLRDTDRPEGAEAFYRQAFETRVAILPAGHHHIAMSARSLAALLRLQGETDEAARLEEAYPETED
ncbi:MAG: serine/threonine-protein kinase [Acidobacteriota bacterium]